MRTPNAPDWSKVGIEKPLNVRIEPHEHPTDWACKRWDDCEDLLLLRWAGTDAGLAAKLHRPVKAITQRRRFLNKS